MQRDKGFPKGGFSGFWIFPNRIHDNSSSMHMYYYPDNRVETVTAFGTLVATGFKTKDGDIIKN